MTGAPLRRADVLESVKRMMISESRLSVSPDQVADDEPLNGALLRVNSLGFVGVLMRLEDELDVTLADDLFVGRSFSTVAEVVDVVMDGAR
jgi:acyl carrier protein